MVWKSSNGKLLFPIGFVYISVDSTSPNQYYGGVWQLLCPGRTLVCIDTSQTEFNTVKKIGGSKNVILSVDQMPNHRHDKIQFYGNPEWDVGNDSGIGFTQKGDHLSVLKFPYYEHRHNSEASLFSTNYTGGNTAHNNLQPFITVYMWVRVS